MCTIVNLGTSIAITHNKHVLYRLLWVIFMECTMSEVGERLAKIEANQENADKRLDKLVDAVEILAKTQADMAVMQNDIGQIKVTQKELTSKVSQIEKTTSQNAMKIASITAIITSAGGYIGWWIKSKL